MDRRDEVITAAGDEKVHVAEDIQKLDEPGMVDAKEDQVTSEDGSRDEGSVVTERGEDGKVRIDGDSKVDADGKVGIDHGAAAEEDDKEESLVAEKKSEKVNLSSGDEVTDKDDVVTDNADVVQQELVGKMENDQGVARDGKGKQVEEVEREEVPVEDVEPREVPVEDVEPREVPVVDDHVKDESQGKVKELEKELEKKQEKEQESPVEGRFGGSETKAEDKAFVNDSAVVDEKGIGAVVDNEIKQEPVDGNEEDSSLEEPERVGKDTSVVDGEEVAVSSPAAGVSMGNSVVGKAKCGLKQIVSWCIPDGQSFDVHSWASGLALGIVITCSAIVITKKCENMSLSR